MPIWGGGSGAASGPWYSTLPLLIPDAKGFLGLPITSVIAVVPDFGMVYEFEGTPGYLGTEEVTGTFTGSSAYFSLPAVLIPAGNPIWLVANGSVGVAPGGTLAPGQFFSGTVLQRTVDGNGNTSLGDGAEPVVEGTLTVAVEIDTSALGATDVIDIRISMGIEESSGLAAAQGFVYSLYLTNVDPT